MGKRVKWVNSILLFQMCSYRPWEQLYRFRIFFIFSLVLNDVRGDTCPSSCSCEEKDIRCNGLIPDYLPSYAENVILYHIDADNFVARKFCNVSWSHNIKQLSFITVKAVGPFNMVDDVFDCLTGLERLQLSDGKIHNFTSGTFNSLLNLSTLDLSGCTEIYTKDISIALSTASSLPKLSSLILVQTGRHGNLEVTQDLIDSLGRRNIKVIDLSQTVILFRASNIDPVCDTLAVFNLSYTQFDSQSRWAMARTCDSLRILDISGMVYPKTYIGPKHIKRINRTYIFDSFLVFLILPTSLFRSLTAFYINNMLGPDHHIEFINCSFSVEFNNSLKEIHMSRSGLNRLEVEVTMVHNHISYVDLSFNDIEEISSNFFSNMSNLTKVDLSFNKLYNIMYFDKTFSEIFTHNKHLVEVDLSRNNLKYLPAETFSTNFALEQLDLSGNSLQQISFEIKQLLNLNKLNLARNSITYLDTNSRKRLDSLYQGRCQRGCRRYRSNKFVVDLQGNPFSCACQSLEFIQWFVSSPIFNETRLLYSCEFDGQKFPLDRNALITAEGDCSRPRRKMRNILLSVFIPLASVAIIAAFIYILLRRRRLLHTKKHYDENVALIRDNPSDQFPVFLSYSSDDRDLVVNHLFKPLEVCKMSVSNTPAVNDNLEIYFEGMKIVFNCDEFKRN